MRTLHTTNRIHTLMNAYMTSAHILAMQGEWHCLHALTSDMHTNNHIYAHLLSAFHTSYRIHNVQHQHQPAWCAWIASRDAKRRTGGAGHLSVRLLCDAPKRAPRGAPPAAKMPPDHVSLRTLSFICAVCVDLGFDRVSDVCTCLCPRTIVSIREEHCSFGMTCLLACNDSLQDV